MLPVNLSLGSVAYCAICPPLTLANMGFEVTRGRTGALVVRRASFFDKADNATVRRKTGGLPSLGASARGKDERLLVCSNTTLLDSRMPEYSRFPVPSPQRCEQAEEQV